MAKADEKSTNDMAGEYTAAFNENAAPPAQPSEDDAFGITPPAEAVAAAEGSPAEEAGETPAAEAEEGAGASAAVGEMDQNSDVGNPAGEAAEPADAGGETPAAEAAEMQDPKEVQRLKSWEGRLKKLESELMAKKEKPVDKVADAIEEVGEQAQASGNEELSEAASQVAEQVEDGTMTPDQAMRQLAEDFGEPFVKMIEAIATSKAMEAGKSAASEAMGSVSKQVEDIISHISDSAEKTHFEKIADAVPDFNDIRQTPEFKQFLESDPERTATAQGGAAKDVIKLLNEFKASTAAEPAKDETPAEPAGDDGADAAAGVRSGGLKIPAEPPMADDYAGAWDEASSEPKKK